MRDCTYTLRHTAYAAVGQERAPPETLFLTGMTSVVRADEDEPLLASFHDDLADRAALAIAPRLAPTVSSYKYHGAFGTIATDILNMSSECRPSCDMSLLSWKSELEPVQPSSSQRYPSEERSLPTGKTSARNPCRVMSIVFDAVRISKCPAVGGFPSVWRDSPDAAGGHRPTALARSTEWRGDSCACRLYQSRHRRPIVPFLWCSAEDWNFPVKINPIIPRPVKLESYIDRDREGRSPKEAGPSGIYRPS